ncbi:hypothetical protein [Phycicoccus flavus]|uniref:Uncharacterized protein n=1 Tax=Phycicoccus flavus TaxID=2502783 RepID=A0A8T6R5T7_9MICO|nr:hypothetical protein [Phycicoccus flavus]NHA69014.1 hypothetical protein [Phycicoccus flavus]
MKKATTTTTRTGLAVRWVPVVDADGRTRMEMQWRTPHRLRTRDAA